MKHLKLFESFDRYEFGQVSLTYLYDLNTKEAKKFPKKEYQELFDILDSCGKFKNIQLQSYSTRDVVYFTWTENKEIPIKIAIHYLGDYCYAIHYHHPNNDMDAEYDGNEYLYLVDSIDGILPAIDLLREKDKNNEE